MKNLHGKGAQIREDIPKLSDGNTHAKFIQDYGQDLFELTYMQFVVPIILAPPAHKLGVKAACNAKLNLFCAAFNMDMG